MSREYIEMTNGSTGVDRFSSSLSSVGHLGVGVFLCHFLRFSFSFHLHFFAARESIHGSKIYHHQYCHSYILGRILEMNKYHIIVHKRRISVLLDFD